MRISFTARHFQPSDKLKEFAHKEVQQLYKFFDEILEADIILDFRKQDQIAEIIIKVNGNKLAVKETSEDMYKSITLGLGKLERQLKKYRGKLRHFEKERIVENIVEDIELEEE
jgi:putative sigma-54 modulation protein